MIPFKTMVYPGCNLKFVLAVFVVFGVIVPLFIQIALILQPGSTTRTIDEETYFESRKIVYEDVDLKKTKIDSLEQQIKELNAIKFKALKFIISLDRQRFSLQKYLFLRSQEKDLLQTELRSVKRQIQKSKREFASHERMKNQKVVTNKVFVGVPYSSNKLSHVGGSLISYQKNNCTFSTCINFSRCPSSKDFRFCIESTNSSQLLSQMKQNIGYASTKSDTCIELYTVSLEDVKIEQTFQKIENSDRNVLILVNSKLRNSDICTKIKNLQYTKTIIVFPVMCSSYRIEFDYIIPTNLPVHNKHPWKVLSPILPVKREYLVSFTYTFLPVLSDVFTSLIFENLKNMPNGDDIVVQSKCSPSPKLCNVGWCMCDQNKETSKKSQYCLIPVSKDNLHLFSNIIDIISTGCVPIFLGNDHKLLPFSSTLDWKTASIFFTYQRLPELVFLLRSLPLEDFINLKRNARFFYETYFSSQHNVLRTIIANFQANIGLPPTLFKTSKAKVIKVIENSGLAVSGSIIKQFSRNLSSIGFNQHTLWNNFPGALNTIPVDPITLALPSEFQFTDEGKDSYSPIGDGKGGDGIAFARSLGGDYPIEQFTVLMLTYDREVILMEALQRLSGMKYLHKVVVVWNNPKDPAPDLNWPDIDIKIEVIRAGKNSLNNRFIPYDVIETEAVLSMDDDIYLRHDEIELAFRIWRENRDRLVGFPGRHHAFNSSSNYFYYNSEHSCELSLVLTGGAFFHKYYSYIYTHILEDSIKEMVNDFMNCEDIAMNFLVAHITKKPPIKVTSRWTFRCPGCPVALSADADHYQERNTCMMYFQQVFGYNPLKRTQFRADSILFKTRIPSTMTKCFQYV